jgi:hypothetical protein
VTADPMDNLVKEAESWKTFEKPSDYRGAVAWAKGVFKRLDAKGAFQVGADTTVFLLDHTYSLALSDPEQYIGLAEKDPVWFNGLKAVAAEILRRNDVMPEQIANWVADLLICKAKEPKPARGRPPTTVHQATIWEAVSQLVRWGWIATRNDESSALSACDVVAQATILSFDRVKDIVEKPWRQPRYLLREWDYARTRLITGIDLP